MTWSGLESDLMSPWLLPSQCSVLLLLLPREEKESLKAVLFEHQNLVSSLEENQERMEEEKRGLLQAKEALSRESDRNTSFSFKVSSTSSSTSSSRSSDC